MYIVTSSRNGPVTDLKTQINKALVISGSLKNIIWRNKHLGIDSKVLICKTCVRPILTYYLETQTGTKHILRAAETTILRKNRIDAYK